MRYAIVTALIAATATVAPTRHVPLAGLTRYSTPSGFGVFTNQTNGVVTYSTTSGAGTIVIGK
jgi:hypothetical protein